MPCLCLNNCLSSKRHGCSCRALGAFCTSNCSCGKRVGCCNAKVQVLREIEHTDLVLIDVYEPNSIKIKKLPLEKKRKKSAGGSQPALVEKVKVLDPIYLEKGKGGRDYEENQWELSLDLNEASAYDIDVGLLTNEEVRIMLKKIQSENPHISLKSYLTEEKRPENVKNKQPWENQVDEMLQGHKEQNNLIEGANKSKSRRKSAVVQMYQMYKYAHTDENKCCTRNQHVGCITEQPRFYNVILSRDVLEIQIVARFHLGRFQHDAADPNKRYRHAAYRQFIYWHWGRLGQGNRRVVPSCVVVKIRSVYPNPGNINYTGFKPHRPLI